MFLLELSAEWLQNIKLNSGIIAKNRVLDYVKTIKSYEKLSKTQQLIRVNTYLNQLQPQDDQLNQKKEDYWETPKEFLSCGFGDCEDYAIIKYYTLLKLGFDKKRLFFTVALEKGSGAYHMVLSYFAKFQQQPLILDNLSFRVLTLNKRDDLYVDVFINFQGVFKLDKKHNLNWVSRAPRQYDMLVERINKEIQ